MHMGPKFNSSAGENRPFVTLDGKYFFFTSNKEARLDPTNAVDIHDLPGNGSRDVYWVDLDVVKELRPL